MADRQKAPVRPQLAASMRSSSYLSDHQQYRPPRQPEPRQGIDSVVELPSSAPVSSPPLKPKVVLPFNGVPSEDNPPTIVESGLSHSFSHPNCAPAPGLFSDRLVVTLFYNRSAGHHDVAAVTAAAPATAAAAPSSTSSLPSPSPFTALPLTSIPDPLAHADVALAADPLPANMAPTTDPDAFPLEPPTHESEQLDHLYGSYISPLCITSFLHLMSSFPQSRGAREPHSSHRCLDSQENPRVVELSLSPAPSAAYLSLPDLRKHETIYRFEREWNVDVALQPDLVWRRYPRLVVFDMDSTLISQEVIELMADTVKESPDLGLRVADITRRAMQGELAFEQSFRERMALLKGISASVFDDLRPKIQLTKGARELVRALKRLGAKTAVLSGGFQPLTSWLARELGIDYAHANRVVILDGKLSGEVEGTIVGKERKRDLLVEIAAKENIDLAQVVAVGDGANDLLMMEKAGLGVAWNAKPRVQMEADARLNGESLLDLLYLFGFTSEEIAMLAK